jgi:hypothetical protein
MGLAFPPPPPRGYYAGMNDRMSWSALRLVAFLGHAAWLGMHLAGIAPAQALLVTTAFSGWLAVLVWGCVLPTLRRSRVIHD